MKEHIENILGFKLEPTITNNPIKIETVTLVNGVVKEEGKPIPAEAYTGSLESNLKKNIWKGRSCWKTEPYKEYGNIICRIHRW